MQNLRCMEKCCLLIYLPFFGLCLFVRLLFVVSLVCLGGGGGGFLAEVAVICSFVSRIIIPIPVWYVRSRVLYVVRICISYEYYILTYISILTNCGRA